MTSDVTLMNSVTMGCASTPVIRLIALDTSNVFEEIAYLVTANPARAHQAGSASTMCVNEIDVMGSSVSPMMMVDIAYVEVVDVS